MGYWHGLCVCVVCVGFQNRDVYMVLLACIRGEGGRRFALMMLMRVCALVGMRERLWFN